jgi:hypothetical protein
MPAGTAVPAAGSTVLYLHAYDKHLWGDNSSSADIELSLMAAAADLARVHELWQLQVLGFNPATDIGPMGHVRGIIKLLESRAAVSGMHAVHESMFIYGSHTMLVAYGVAVQTPFMLGKQYYGSHSCGTPGRRFTM